MRYHWGHGIGHVYSHDDAPTASEAAHIVTVPAIADEEPEDDAEGVIHGLGLEEQPDSVSEGTQTPADASGGESDEESPEHSLDNLEDDELDVAGDENYETDSDEDIQDADDEYD